MASNSEGLDRYRETPTTQGGVAPDMEAKHAQERPAEQSLEPVLADAPDPRETTPIVDSTATGVWNSGKDIDGWHPGR